MNTLAHDLEGIERGLELVAQVPSRPWYVNFDGAGHAIVFQGDGGTGNSQGLLTVDGFGGPREIVDEESEQIAEFVAIACSSWEELARFYLKSHHKSP